jgi:hypothetical protein
MRLSVCQPRNQNVTLCRQTVLDLARLHVFSFSTGSCYVASIDPYARPDALISLSVQQSFFKKILQNNS